MKKLIFLMILNALLAYSCATQYASQRPYCVGPFFVGTNYGAHVSYGDNRHAGIDLNISAGTPIIASSDGRIVEVGDPCPGMWYCGGIFVAISHGFSFITRYGHLEKVYVTNGQKIKRGQLIGLSGANNNGYEHLHFAICSDIGACPYSNSYDPNKFWLGGEPQCFDPDKDYSSYSKKYLTLPVDCVEYTKNLTTQTK